MIKKVFFPKYSPEHKPEQTNFFFTIFDVETNGLHPDSYSVLSFSALNVQTWRSNGHRHFKIQKEFDRFYYPQEPYNYHAIKVNGLTQDVITQKRGRTGGGYPLHFPQDTEVVTFCQQINLMQG